MSTLATAMAIAPRENGEGAARRVKLLLCGALLTAVVCALTPTIGKAGISPPDQTMLTAEMMGSGALAQRLHAARIALQHEDYDEAHLLLTILAEQGQKDAQFMLGLTYSNGLGVVSDTAQAARWYQLAAEQGHVDAQYNLAVAYSLGTGVVANATQAASWYHKAALQGSTDAQFNLGLLYAQGEGVSKDMLEAGKWWFKAASKGDAAAQFALGLMYVRGDGVDQDVNEALKWWYLSASQGFERAQDALRRLGIVIRPN